MKIHAVWCRTLTPGGLTRGAEWVLLILGLAALDTYVWINTAALLSQAYEDWAFDQRLRGLLPSISGFAFDEARALFSKEPVKPEAPETTARIAEPDASGAIPPARSAVIGRLEIPNLHLAVMVREGADAGTLRQAVGHIPGTAFPGRRGNVGLAGHRDTFFRPLRKIRQGDAIEFQTVNGTYRYVVESTRIVKPQEVDVLASSGREMMTLVTCYPFYYVGSAPQRFIVHAALVQSPRGD